MSRDIAPFGLRMPTELKQRIEQSAKANGRSLNAEIVAILQQSMESRPAFDTEEFVENLAERIANKLQRK